MKSILVSYQEPSMEVFLALWMIQMFGRSAPIGFRHARVVYYKDTQPPAPLNLQEDVLILMPGCLSVKNEKEFFAGLLIPPLGRSILRDYVLKVRGLGVFAQDFNQTMVSTRKLAPVLFVEAARFFEGVFGDQLRMVTISDRDEFGVITSQTEGKRNEKELSLL